MVQKRLMLGAGLAGRKVKSPWWRRNPPLQRQRKEAMGTRMLCRTKVCPEVSMRRGSYSSIKAELIFPAQSVA